MGDLNKINKKKIAAETGLSYSTVMRYFNGAAGVSAASAKLISGCVNSEPPGGMWNEAEYRARGIYEIAATFPSYYNFFWDSAARAFLRCTYARGINYELRKRVIRYSYRDGDYFENVLKILDRIGAAGYILAPQVCRSALPALADFVRNHPTVLICNTAESVEALGEVTCDYETEMEKFAELISRFDGDVFKHILLIETGDGGCYYRPLIPMLGKYLSAAGNVEIVGVAKYEPSCLMSLLPSVFARLMSDYAGRFDSVFIDNGATDSLCAAIDKLRQNLGSNGKRLKDITVFGMDASPARMAGYGRRYRGIYSCQDVADQTSAAFNILTDCLYGSGNLPKKLVTSFTYNRI